MIASDDRRHGTVAGYLAGCRSCAACRAAMVDYEKRRRHDVHRGHQRIVDATGSRRRVEALQAIGWSTPAIARAYGGHQRAVWRFTSQAVVNRTSAERMRQVYDELSMTLPTTTTPGDRMSVSKTLANARRKHFLPPLVWDDDTIDDPSALPTQDGPSGEVDHILVQRGVSGRPVNANRRERLEIIKRWQRQGWSLNELDRIQGWNAHRDLRLERAA